MSSFVTLQADETHGLRVSVSYLLAFG